LNLSRLVGIPLFHLVSTIKSAFSVNWTTRQDSLSRKELRCLFTVSRRRR